MELNHKTQNFTRMESGRIAYYSGSPLSGQVFWNSHWGSHANLESFYIPYRNGYLGYSILSYILRRYLPKGGCVLEAGCGMAQHVVALRALGYDCIGIDFAEQTIHKVKGVFPELPVIKGDILSLPFPDASIRAYISLGVVEHFSDGPGQAIREAYRVLENDGVLVISVPQAFSWRKEKAESEGTPIPRDSQFYQYAFPPEELRQKILDAGFSVLAEYGYESHYGLKLRFKWFKQLLHMFPRLSHIDILLDRTFVGCEIARMRMYVAKKI